MRENPPDPQVDTKALMKANVFVYLEQAMLELRMLPQSRETAIVKTKIEEANLWMSQV